MQELGAPASSRDAAELMALLDTNGDQDVSLQEFLDFYKKVGSAGVWDVLAGPVIVTGIRWWLVAAAGCGDGSVTSASKRADLTNGSAARSAQHCTALHCTA
jgi:hypothetical protein